MIESQEIAIVPITETTKASVNEDDPRDRYRLHPIHRYPLLEATEEKKWTKFPMAVQCFSTRHRDTKDSHAEILTIYMRKAKKNCE